MEVIFSNKTNILDALLLTTHDNSPIYEIKSTFGLMGRRETVVKDVNPLGSGSSLHAGHARYESHHSRAASHTGNRDGKKEPIRVGAIYWKDKSFEIHGVKRKISELKKKKGLLNRSRYWCWSEDRKEYEVRHDGDKEWVVTVCEPPISHQSSSKQKDKGSASSPKNRSHERDSTSKSDRRDKPSSHTKGMSSSEPEHTSRPEGRHGSSQNQASDSDPPSPTGTMAPDALTIKDNESAASFRVPYRPHLFHSSKKPPSCVLSLSREALEEDEVFLILVLLYSEARRMEGMNGSVGSGVEGI